MHNEAGFIDITFIAGSMVIVGGMIALIMLYVIARNTDKILDELRKQKEQ